MRLVDLRNGQLWTPRRQAASIGLVGISLLIDCAKTTIAVRGNFATGSYSRCIMTTATYSSFKCPKVDCRTFYVVSHHSERPQRQPRCLVCNTPFLEKDGAQHLQYWPTRELANHYTGSPD